MATATGFPIEIPIITRSVVASLARTSPAENTFLVPQLQLLRALDAGTSEGDPCDTVRTYACDWWNAGQTPGMHTLLGPDTQAACLEHHQQYCDLSPGTTTYEKPAYSWAATGNAAAMSCPTCPALNSIVVAVVDELRQLRLQADALDTLLDTECGLSNRRTAGAHSLFSAAILKDTGSEGKFPIKVAGTVRKAKKGPEVVERVGKEAGEGLKRLQELPDMKWTSGVALSHLDLIDMMGSAYNNRLEETHSGYDSELPDGTLTGVDSDAPPVRGKARKERFDALSPDIVDPPTLGLEDIPTVFQIYPLAQRNTDDRLQEALQERMPMMKLPKYRKNPPIVRRPVTPPQEITSLHIPLPPTMSFPTTKGMATSAQVTADDIANIWASSDDETPTAGSAPQLAAINVSDLAAAWSDDEATSAQETGDIGNIGIGDLADAWKDDESDASDRPAGTIGLKDMVAAWDNESNDGNPYYQF